MLIFRKCYNQFQAISLQKESIRASQRKPKDFNIKYKHVQKAECVKSISKIEIQRHEKNNNLKMSLLETDFDEKTNSKKIVISFKF